MREQERYIALQIRTEVQLRRERELQNLAEELKGEWEQQQSEKLETLQKLYQDNLRILGEGHRSAKENVNTQLSTCILAMCDTLQAASVTWLGFVRFFKQLGSCPRSQNTGVFTSLYNWLINAHFLFPQEPDWEAIAQKNEENHVRADERYRVALKELKSQRQKDQEEQNRWGYQRDFIWSNKHWLVTLFDIKSGMFFFSLKFYRG